MRQSLECCAATKLANQPASYSAMLKIYFKITTGAISLQNTNLKLDYLRLCPMAANRVLSITLIAGFFGFLYLNGPKSPIVCYMCFFFKFFVQVTQLLHAKNRSKLHLNQFNCAFHCFTLFFIQLNYNCLIQRCSKLFLHRSELCINGAGTRVARFHKTGGDFACQFHLNIASGRTAQTVRLLSSCLCGGQCQFLLLVLQKVAQIKIKFCVVLFYGFFNKLIVVFHKPFY